METQIYFFKVPRKLLRGEVGDEEEVRFKHGKSGGKSLFKNFLHIHESSPNAAPRRYITFLKTYKSVYNNKKHGVVKRQQHLQVSNMSTKCPTSTN